MAIIKAFSVSKKHATDGDYVSVTWECSMPDSVVLSTDNGYRSDRLNVSDSGSTNILVGHSKGKTIVTLVAVLGKTKESRSESIRVNNRKPVRTNPSGIGKLRIFRERMQAGWAQTKAQFQYWWQYLPKKKKTVYKILFFIWLALIAFSIVTPITGRNHSKTVPPSESVTV